MRNPIKREELEKLITELSPKEFTKEKSMPVLNELWHDIVFNLKTAIEKACEPERQLFEHIWVTRLIDGSNAEGILDHFQKLNTNVKEIGLLLSMETFKSAGSKAFSVEKYLSIKLNSTCYTISHKASNRITKDYHEKLNAQELEEISGRLVNLALGAINKKIKQIIK